MKTLEERKAALAKEVTTAVVYGARVQSQSDTMAVVVTRKPVNHLLHLIAGFPTLGLWWLVWICLAIFAGEKREIITVDEYGDVSRQKAFS